VLLAILGPLLAPHSSTETIGAPGDMPSGDALLGTDVAGRDVLSRMMTGAGSVLLLGISAVGVAYALGGAVGLVAGLSRSLTDSVLMRTMDVLLAFPALLLVLLAVAGFGGSVIVLVIATALLEVPQISRIVRTATLETSVKGYVEVAQARGEGTATILRRDILPNIGGTVLADVGLRFAYCLIIIATVNFLGLGLQPPSSDWGVMIAENRPLISTNPWATFAPAIMFALLTIGFNMVGDSLARSLGRSDVTVAEPASMSDLTTADLVAPDSGPDTAITAGARP
jgi:ABC-type dipeptide/oligopeptide/nickel transport system permease subunit